MNRPFTQRHDGTDGLVASTRDLADLARSGYEILQEPFTHVDFEVHHTVDRPGYLRDNIFASPGKLPPGVGECNPGSIAVEALASAANGVGLVIGTNRGTDAPVRPPTGQGGGYAAHTIVAEPNRRIFRGTALPNPTFLFESATTYEGIISIEAAPRSLRFNRSIEVRDLIREISRIAADVASAPLLFLQCPAQLPDHSFVSQDVRSYKVASARRSSALAVRFAIALQGPSARLRCELTDILIRYCTERQFGFWLADTRIGYRSGNWFQICVHDDDSSRRGRKEQAESGDSYPVEICLPVTFIGPARIGSTYTIVSFLSKFGDIGVVSASLTTLDDLAFIHLQLSIAGTRHSNLQALNAQLGEQVSWAANPPEAIVHIQRALSVSAREASPYIYYSETSGHVGDYQTLAGPLLRCSPPDRLKRIAVWFSWQMEGVGEDLAIPLVKLFASFSDLGLGKQIGRVDVDSTETVEGANLEYLICRDIGNSVIRGRGKFSIPEAGMLAMFDGNGVEPAAVKLCMSLEDAWKTSLRRCGVRGVSELALSWREWWLGHWASPI